jgi:23S rRNA (cytidine1920-2'-O)/16S rRNA (cytidine1409-2'-O)-methyltransferase
MERTNIRSVESLPEAASIAVIDVSFISLRTVLPPVQKLLTPLAELIALIKPQFEAGKQRVGKKGVVRDPGVWREVLESVLTFSQSHGWKVSGLARSPIRGPAGNVEFLAHLSRRPDAPSIDLRRAIEEVVSVPSESEDE